MGVGFDVFCVDCGMGWACSEGGGFLFDLLHCDRCGTSLGVDRGGSRRRGSRQCRCGGRFRPDAPARCPRCRSLRREDDPSGAVTMYD